MICPKVESRIKSVIFSMKRMNRQLQAAVCKMKREIENLLQFSSLCILKVCSPIRKEDYVARAEIFFQQIESSV